MLSSVGSHSLSPGQETEEGLGVQKGGRGQVEADMGWNIFTVSGLHSQSQKSFVTRYKRERRQPLCCACYVLCFQFD